MGGFGYNFSVCVFIVDQIILFFFIDQYVMDNVGDVLEVLQKLISVGQDVWFQFLLDMYWVVVGMKIDVFQMIVFDVVVVVQFGIFIKLGIFGVVLVDVFSSLLDFKFVYVEFGFVVVVDFDIGIMKVEVQFFFKFYIFYLSCKLMGGFVFWYWFDVFYVDQVNVGNFVFFFGGYYQVFKVLVGWFVLDCFKINWGLGNNLFILGEVFFVIIFKVCMGGGRF